MWFLVDMRLYADVSMFDRAAAGNMNANNTTLQHSLNFRISQISQIKLYQSIVNEFGWQKCIISVLRNWSHLWLLMYAIQDNSPEIMWESFDWTHITMWVLFNLSNTRSGWPEKSHTITSKVFPWLKTYWFFKELLSTIDQSRLIYDESGLV